MVCIRGYTTWAYNTALSICLDYDTYCISDCFSSNIMSTEMSGKLLLQFISNNFPLSKIENNGEFVNKVIQKAEETDLIVDPKEVAAAILKISII